jgi:hypothetical protein
MMRGQAKEGQRQPGQHLMCDDEERENGPCLGQHPEWASGSLAFIPRSALAVMVPVTTSGSGQGLSRSTPEAGLVLIPVAPPSKGKKDERKMVAGWLASSAWVLGKALTGCEGCVGASLPLRHCGSRQLGGLPGPSTPCPPAGLTLVGFPWPC